MQHGDHGDPRAAQDRERRGDEQRQPAVGEGEDRVVQEDRVRALARQLAAERSPPRTDLDPSAANRLLAAIQPVQRAGDLLAAQPLGEQQGVVARAAGRPHGHADDSNAQRRYPRADIGLAPSIGCPARVSRRRATAGSASPYVSLLTEDLPAVGGVDRLRERVEIAGRHDQPVATGSISSRMPVLALTIAGTPQASASTGA